MEPITLDVANNHTIKKPQASAIAADRFLGNKISHCSRPKAVNSYKIPILKIMSLLSKLFS